MNAWKFTLLFYAVSAGLANPARGQVVPPDAEQQVTLTSDPDSLTFAVTDPRPMFQLASKLKEEYGWLVDYEDPAYSQDELVDDTDPKWLLAHPSAPHVTRPAGTTFRSSLPKASFLDDREAPDASRLLSLLSANFNQHSAPGIFTTATQSDGRTTLIGSSKYVSKSVLDTVVALPAGNMSAMTALKAIFAQLSDRNGVKVVLGYAPAAQLMACNVDLGTGESSARGLLIKILDALPRAFDYQAMYDADARLYMVNVQVALQTYQDVTGEQHRSFLPWNRPTAP